MVVSGQWSCVLQAPMLSPRSPFLGVENSAWKKRFLRLVELTVAKLPTKRCTAMPYALLKDLHCISPHVGTSGQIYSFYSAYLKHPSFAIQSRRQLCVARGGGGGGIFRVTDEWEVGNGDIGDNGVRHGDGHVYDGHHGSEERNHEVSDDREDAGHYAAENGGDRKPSSSRMVVDGNLQAMSAIAEDLQQGNIGDVANTKSEVQSGSWEEFGLDILEAYRQDNGTDREGKITVADQKNFTELGIAIQNDISFDGESAKVEGLGISRDSAREHEGTMPAFFSLPAVGTLLAEQLVVRGTSVLRDFREQERANSSASPSGGGEALESEKSVFEGQAEPEGCPGEKFGTVAKGFRTKVGEAIAATQESTAMEVGTMVFMTVAPLLLVAAIYIVVTQCFGQTSAPSPAPPSWWMRMAPAGAAGAVAGFAGLGIAAKTTPLAALIVPQMEAIWRSFGGASVVALYWRTLVFGKTFRTIEWDLRNGADYPDGPMRSVTIRISNLRAVKAKIAAANGVEGGPAAVRQLAMWISTSHDFFEPLRRARDLALVPDFGFVVWTACDPDELALPSRGSRKKKATTSSGQQPTASSAAVAAEELAFMVSAVARVLSEAKLSCGPQGEGTDVDREKRRVPKGEVVGESGLHVGEDIRWGGPQSSCDMLCVSSGYGSAAQWAEGGAGNRDGWAHTTAEAGGGGRWGKSEGGCGHTSESCDDETRARCRCVDIGELGEQHQPEVNKDRRMFDERGKGDDSGTYRGRTDRNFRVSTAKLSDFADDSCKETMSQCIDGSSVVRGGTSQSAIQDVPKLPPTMDVQRAALNLSEEEENEIVDRVIQMDPAVVALFKAFYEVDPQKFVRHVVYHIRKNPR